MRRHASSWRLLCDALAAGAVANACTRLNKLELSNLRCLSDPALYEFIHVSPWRGGQGRTDPNNDWKWRALSRSPPPCMATMHVGRPL